MLVYNQLQKEPIPPFKRDTKFHPPKNKALIPCHLLSLYLLIWGRLKNGFLVTQLHLDVKFLGYFIDQMQRDSLGVQ